MKEELPEETLGQRLRKTRIQKGLDIKQVANMAEISPVTLSMWERDIHKPARPKDLKKVANVLGTTVKYLLGPLPENTPIGYKLVYYRWCTGLTQKKMAQLIGVDPGTLSDAERGKVTPYASKKLAGLLSSFV